MPSSRQYMPPPPTPSRLQLKRLINLLLTERPPVLVSVDTPEPHTIVIRGTQYFTPSFARPLLEERKLLAFARDIQLV